MNRTCDYDETGQIVCDLDLIRVIQLKSAQLEPRDYDRKVHEECTGFESLFRSLKWFHWTFSRFDKPDITCAVFIDFALITDALDSVNTPQEKH